MKEKVFLIIGNKDSYFIFCFVRKVVYLFKKVFIFIGRVFKKVVKVFKCCILFIWDFLDWDE